MMRKPVVYIDVKDDEEEEDSRLSLATNPSISLLTAPASFLLALTKAVTSSGGTNVS